MSLNDDANLDPSQVEDLRGRRRGGGGIFRLPSPGPGTGRPGGGLPIPRLGGGGGKGRLGLAAVVVVCLLGLLCTGGAGAGLLPDLGGLGSLGGLIGDSADGDGDPEVPLAQLCAVDNPDRFNEVACRNLAYVNSIQDYWRRALPESFGTPYPPTTTRYFSGAVSTGCGNAGSGTGPFYCPADNHVYIDLSFYDELAQRFGATGEFAQAYVLAHEYGHHVQTVLGIEAQVRRAQQRDPGNANTYLVMLELQADCLAGAWAHGAAGTTDASGQPLFTAVTDQHLRDALAAAAAVGDDTIQQRTTGGVDPESFTHGTAQQRQQWFFTGYSTGDPRQCHTFGDAIG